MTRHSTIAMVVGTLVGITAPYATRAEPATTGNAVHSSSLKEESYRGIRFLTGGVGTREQEEMSALAKDYDVFLVMSSESGAYLAGVELAFRDAEGRDVLLATSRGPFFLIDLPDGRYEVTARRPSAPIERRSINVRRGATQTLHFSLPVQPGS